jgi:hypothetical protein
MRPVKWDLMADGPTVLASYYPAFASSVPSTDPSRATREEVAMAVWSRCGYSVYSTLRKMFGHR